MTRARRRCGFSLLPIILQNLASNVHINYASTVKRCKGSFTPDAVLCGALRCGAARHHDATHRIRCEKNLRSTRFGELRKGETHDKQNVSDCQTVAKTQPATVSSSRLVIHHHLRRCRCNRDIIYTAYIWLQHKQTTDTLTANSHRPI